MSSIENKGSVSNTFFNRIKQGINEFDSEVAKLNDFLTVYKSATAQNQQTSNSEAPSISGFISYIWSGSVDQTDANAEFLETTNEKIGANIYELHQIGKEAREMKNSNLNSSDAVSVLELEKKFLVARNAFLINQMALFNKLNAPERSKIAEEKFVETTQLIQEFETMIQVEKEKILEFRTAELASSTEKFTIISDYMQERLIPLLTDHQSTKSFAQMSPEKTTIIDAEIRNMSNIRQMINICLENYKKTGNDLSGVKEEVEALCYEFQKSCQLFLETLAEANIEKQTLLKQNVFKMPSGDEASSSNQPALSNDSDVNLELLVKQNDDICKELKASLKQLKTLTNEKSSSNASDSYEWVGIGESINYVPTAAHTEKEQINEKQTWSLTTWGSLINTEAGVFNYIINFGSNFKTTVDALKNARDELIGRIQAQGGVDEELQNALNDTNRVFYHTILVRLVDVISEKQAQVKQETLKNNVEAVKLLQIELNTLNNKYKSCFKAYSDLYVENQSGINSVLNNLKSIVTLGLMNDRMYSPKEIKNTKLLADQGYGIMSILLEWIQAVRTSNTDITTTLRIEITDFLEWAKTNPREAVDMAGDMALTCSIIGDKSFLDQFNDQMRLKAYSLAFTEEWKPFDEETPEPTPQTLKYKALSQLLRYAPVLTSTVKTLATAKSYNPLSLAGNLVAGAIGGLLIQQTSHAVNGEQATIALQVSNIIKGEPLQKIIEEQRNVELARVAGITTCLVLNPKGFFKKAVRETRLWFRTLKAARGWELVGRIALQVILPTLGILSVVGVGAAVVFFGTPITLITAPTTSFVLIGCTITLARKIDGVFNTMFDTRSKIEAEFKQEKNPKIAEKIRNDQEPIRAERKKYVQQLQKFKVLPKTSLVDTEELGIEIMLPFQTAKCNIMNRLKVDLNLKESELVETPRPMDFVRTFVTHGLNRIELAVKQELANTKYDGHLGSNGTKKALALAVSRQLMKEWLYKRLDKAFTERAVEIAIQGTVSEKTPEELETEMKTLIETEALKLEPWKIADQTSKDALKQELNRHFGG